MSLVNDKSEIPHPTHIECKPSYSIREKDDQWRILSKFVGGTKIVCNIN